MWRFYLLHLSLHALVEDLPGCKARRWKWLLARQAATGVAIIRQTRGRSVELGEVEQSHGRPLTVLMERGVAEILFRLWLRSRQGFILECSLSVCPTFCEIPPKKLDCGPCSEDDSRSFGPRFISGVCLHCHTQDKLIYSSLYPRNPPNT
jgi:hypothetical protein